MKINEKDKKRHIGQLAPSPLLYCLPVARTDIDCLVRGYHHQLHTFILEICLFDFSWQTLRVRVFGWDVFQQMYLRCFYVRELVLLQSNLIFPQTWQVVSLPIQMCLPILTQWPKLSLLVTYILYIFCCWKGHQIKGQPIYNVRIHNVTFSLSKELRPLSWRRLQVGQAVRDKSKS